MYNLNFINPLKVLRLPKFIPSPLAMHHMMKVEIFDDTMSVIIEK